jgi:hypothetical protein
MAQISLRFPSKKKTETCCRKVESFVYETQYNRRRSHIHTYTHSYKRTYILPYKHLRETALKRRLFRMLT